MRWNECRSTRRRDSQSSEARWQNRFRGDGKLALQQQIVDAYHGTGERILHRNQQGIGGAIRNGAKRRIKRGSRYGDNVLAKQLHGRGFAEGSGFSLEGDAHFLRLCSHYASSLSKRRAAPKP